jgi:hypothetical protein
LIVKDSIDREIAKGAFDAAGGSRRVKWMPSLDRALDWIVKKESRVLLVSVSDEVKSGAKHWLELKRSILEKCGAVLFYFPRESAHEGEVEEKVFGCRSVFMIPLQGGKLSLFGKISVVLDRFLGSK